MWVEVKFDDSGNVTTVYGRLYPPPYGWKDKENHKMVQLNAPENLPDPKRPQKIYNLVKDGRAKEGYRWEFSRERWLNSYIRPKRNKLLNEIDAKYCNPERWNNRLTKSQKDQITALKQQLLDLPDTIEYGNEQWPEMPDF
jgi:hypothetical protein